MENIDIWWKQTGAKELNAKLVELTGMKIGYIPIENVLDIQLDGKDLKQLSALLSNDGIEVREIVNQNKYLICIK